MERKDIEEVFQALRKTKLYSNLYTDTKVNDEGKDDHLDMCVMQAMASQIVAYSMIRRVSFEAQSKDDSLEDLVKDAAADAVSLLTRCIYLNWMWYKARQSH